MSPTAAPTAGPRWKEPTKDQGYAFVAASLGWTRDAFGALVVFILALVVGPET